MSQNHRNLSSQDQFYPRNSSYQQHIELGVQTYQPQGQGKVANSESSRYSTFANEEYPGLTTLNPVSQSHFPYVLSQPVPSYPQNYVNRQLPLDARYNMVGYQLQSPDQMNLLNQQIQAFIVETKLRTEFCCYTCLVYLGLIGSILSALLSLNGILTFGYGSWPFIFSVAYLAGFVLAIWAKSSFDVKKQYYVFFIFCLMMITTLLNGLYLFPIVMGVYKVSHSGGQIRMRLDDSDELTLENTLKGVQTLVITVLIIFPLALNLLIIHYANALYKLMKQRDYLLGTLVSSIQV